MQKHRHQPVFKNNKHQTWRAWCHYWRKPFWPRYMLHQKGAFQIPRFFLGVVGVGGGVLFQCFFVVFAPKLMGRSFFGNMIQSWGCNCLSKDDLLVIEHDNNCMMQRFLQSEPHPQQKKWTAGLSEEFQQQHASKDLDMCKNEDEILRTYTKDYHTHTVNSNQIMINWHESALKIHLFFMQQQNKHLSSILRMIRIFHLAMLIYRPGLFGSIPLTQDAILANEGLGWDFHPFFLLKSHTPKLNPFPPPDFLHEDRPKYNLSPTLIFFWNKGMSCPKSYLLGGNWSCEGFVSIDEF